MMCIGFVNSCWNNFPHFEVFPSTFVLFFFLRIVGCGAGSGWCSGLEAFLQLFCKESKEIDVQGARKTPQCSRVNGLSFKDFIDVGAFATYLLGKPADGASLVFYDLTYDGAHVYFFHGGCVLCSAVSLMAEGE